MQEMVSLYKKTKLTLIKLKAIKGLSVWRPTRMIKKQPQWNSVKALWNTDITLPWGALINIILRVEAEVSKSLVRERALWTSKKQLVTTVNNLKETEVEKIWNFYTSEMIKYSLVKAACGKVFTLSKILIDKEACVNLIFMFTVQHCYLLII